MKLLAWGLPSTGMPFRPLLFLVKRLSYISNNVGPGKLFLKTLLSFHLKEVFSFVFFRFLFLFCIDDHGSFVI